ncbi:unnamed protein product [Taenia asiatica]|uniref:Secreted protein n=1 Tax=Taenia asiatica TaxID=60517 RepID=A0A0R3WAT4_TAEAS|nr:unnamed protein product [Taenia asiatica]
MSVRLERLVATLMAFRCLLESPLQLDGSLLPAGGVQLREFSSVAVGDMNHLRVEDFKAVHGSGCGRSSIDNKTAALNSVPW